MAVDWGKSRFLARSVAGGGGGGVASNRTHEPAPGLAYHCRFPLVIRLHSFMSTSHSQGQYCRDSRVLASRVNMETEVWHKPLQAPPGESRDQEERTIGICPIKFGDILHSFKPPFEVQFVLTKEHVAGCMARLGCS